MHTSYLSMNIVCHIHTAIFKCTIFRLLFITVHVVLSSVLFFPLVYILVLICSKELNNSFPPGLYFFFLLYCNHNLLTNPHYHFLKTNMKNVYAYVGKDKEILKALIGSFASHTT